MAVPNLTVMYCSSADARPCASERAVLGTRSVVLRRAEAGTTTAAFYFFYCLAAVPLVDVHYTRS